jgi:dTDP-4-amino-4,6-dideoxy-D-galactose acyltransferase
MSDADLCELLPWDSTFFGFPIARIRGHTLTAQSADAIDAWCREHRIKCLYFIARPDDPTTVEIAEQHGYHLADVRLTFERDLKSQILNPKSDIIRPALPSDIPALRAIARASHTDTRFFFDPHFPREKCHALYETWIESSVHGFADKVLTGTGGEGEVAGYITCHLTTPRIGLIAVSPNYQSKGLGRALVESALAFFHSRGAARVSVVTQGRNLAAQRLYTRCSFLPARLELYYHRWP